MSAVDFDIRDAVEIAASATNASQSPRGVSFAGSEGAAVSPKRLFEARHIIGRFLELAPDDLSALELRELLDQDMPALFMEAP